MGSSQFLWWFLEKQAEVTLLTPGGVGAADCFKTDLDFLPSVVLFSGRK